MASSRLRVPCLLLLAVGLSVLIPACGEEEVPAPTTPAPAPPPTPTPPPAPDPPATPTGLNVSARGPDFIEWAWTPVPEVSGYDVQYSTNEAFTDEDEVIARTAEQFSYRRAGLAAETSGYLRVRSAAGTGDERITSDWSNHVTGMTMAAAPTTLPAPQNFRVTDQTDTTMTWSWNAVDGADGYRLQHNDNGTFADRDSGASTTRPTYTAENLPSGAARHARVQAYVGPPTERVYGRWSLTVEGTTDQPTPPPAPAVTALSAPTGVRTGSPRTDSITVSWSNVTDAAEYEVQRQQLPDGLWEGASCGGDDARVTTLSCVASGLDPGTNYSFRVRAHPDPDDETKRFSDWSSAEPARTSGEQQTEITGGDDVLTVTWESELGDRDGSITWYWDPPADNRISFLTAVLESSSDSCPSLIGTGATAWGTATPTFSETLTLTSDLSHQVRGLCVVSTWKDPNGNDRYGKIALAWAATPPTAPTAAPAAGLIPLGEKDKNNKTTAIDWYFTTEEGFEYVHGTVSALVGSAVPSCDSISSTSSNQGTGNDVRFRRSGPTDYTQYRGCVRAKNKKGFSKWTALPIYSARPAAPTLTFTTTSNKKDGPLAWEVTFSHATHIPTDPGQYDIIVGKQDAEPADDSVCTGSTVQPMETGQGFKRAGTAHGWGDPASRETVWIYACVTAKLPSTALPAEGEGPTRFKKQKVTEPAS